MGPRGRSGQVRKISHLTEIRSPDHPARSQSLFRLSYPAQVLSLEAAFFFIYLHSITRSDMFDISIVIYN